jgi:hypothetical protein
MTRNMLRLLAATALAAPILALLAARTAAARRLRRDARQLFAAADNGPARVYDEAQLMGLPATVQRYFSHVSRSDEIVCIISVSFGYESR